MRANLLLFWPLSARCFVHWLSAPGGTNGGTDPRAQSQWKPHPSPIGPPHRRTHRGRLPCEYGPSGPRGDSSTGWSRVRVPPGASGLGAPLFGRASVLSGWREEETHNKRRRRQRRAKQKRETDSRSPREIFGPCDNLCRNYRYKLR